jgi:hypothetical protein
LFNADHITRKAQVENKLVEMVGDLIIVERTSKNSEADKLGENEKRNRHWIEGVTVCALEFKGCQKKW